MKNLFKLFSFFPLFFLLISPAFVQRSVSTPAGIKEQVKEKIETRIATREARLTKLKKNLVRNHFTRMRKRLSAAIRRLEKIAARIESRINKIEAESPNSDISSIRKEIFSVREKINNVGDNLLPQAQEKFDQMVESENPQELFSEVKHLIRTIKDELIEVHQILVKVIGDIKGLRVGTTVKE